MKKKKWAAGLVALVSMIGFYSCIDNDGSGFNWDAADYVTVKQELGIAYLMTDNGVSLYPTTTSVLASLQKSTGEYYPRAIVYYKYAEGEAFDANKSSYNISAIVGGQILDTKEFTESPDTLEADYPITSLEYPGWSTIVWAKNGYLNVPFVTTVGTNVNVDDFNMYVTGVSGDTLITRFHQSGGGENSSESVGSLICFKLPFNSSAYNELVPTQDSIVIKVVAKGTNNQELVKTTKYRWSER